MTRSVGSLLDEARARRGDAPAFRTRTTAGWVTRTWSELHETAAAVACALADMGVQSGDRVALLSHTRREGAEAVFGAACAGAVVVTLPPRPDDHALAALLADASPRVLVVDDPASLARVLALHDAQRDVRRFVVLDAIATGDERTRPTLRLADVLSVRDRARVMLWTDLVAAGRRLLDRGTKPALPRDADAPFARVFTTGRHGAPRPVTITHRRALASVDALVEHLALTDDDAQLAVAPISSAFGLSQVVAAARAGIITSFPAPGMRPEAQLAEVRPTLLAAPASFYERVRSEALAHVMARGRLTRSAIDAALAVGLRVASLERKGQSPGLALRAAHRGARALVLDAIRARIGDRVRLAVSTGSHLSVGVAEWFHACGVLLLEGYGLAEACGVTHLNTPRAYRFGTVGRPLPGVLARFADDGEIVLQGPMIEQELPTGDMGYVDRDGYLVVQKRRAR